MMRLMFYWGPGDLITKTIRLLTGGPYSHVELQFSDGHRFFSSGHGLLRGSHMVDDHKVYDRWWDKVTIKSTAAQEADAEGFAFMMVGFPFDWRGMFSFLVPFFKRNHQGQYCSSLVLEILQKALHLYPGVQTKLSPNGLYRLFIYNPSREVSLDATDEDVG